MQLTPDAITETTDDVRRELEVDSFGTQAVARAGAPVPAASVLRDGRAVLIRPLEASDRAVYAAAVAKLSPRSRAMRFFTPKGLSEAEIDAFTQIDGVGHVALVAVDPVDGTGLGVARYVRLEDRPGEAEIAMAIADDWQGTGLGRALTQALVDRARDAGLCTLVAVTLSENRPAIGLLRSLGFTLHGRDGIYTDLRLELS